MTTIAHAYRRPMTSPGDGLFHRCLSAAAMAGFLFWVIVLLTPMRRHVVTSVEQLPPRFAKLILAEAKPVVVAPVEGSRGTPGLAPGAPGPVAPGDPGPIGDNAPAPAAPGPAAPVGRPDLPRGPEVGRGAGAGPATGAAGRARAQAAVTSQLASATSSIEKSLAGLSSSLAGVPSTGAAPGGARSRRGRAINAGRSVGELGAVASGGAGVGGGSADLGGSSIGGSWVSVGTLSAVGGGGGGGVGGGTGLGGGGGGGGGGGNGGGGGAGGGGGGAGGTAGGYGYGAGVGNGGSAPGVYRSNASLLAVIQKYAPGIQYCYGNELKGNPGLHGKMIVALTVEASGEVSKAVVVSNTVGSERLATCALAQIRDWKFPPVTGGATTFQAPFVFTPPQ